MKVNLILGASLLLLSGQVGAAPLMLYGIGAITDDSKSGNCDGDNSCNGRGDWYYIDNFILESDATVTSFSYSSRLYSGSIANYSGTD